MFLSLNLTNLYSWDFLVLSVSVYLLCMFFNKTTLLGFFWNTFIYLCFCTTIFLLTGLEPFAGFFLLIEMSGIFYLFILINQFKFFTLLKQTLPLYCFFLLYAQTHLQSILVTNWYLLKTQSTKNDFFTILLFFQSNNTLLFVYLLWALLIFSIFLIYLVSLLTYKALNQSFTTSCFFSYFSVLQHYTNPVVSSLYTSASPYITKWKLTC